MLPAIRFVMIETSHPGNIGAAARAMKNMQFDQLYLVNPRAFPHPEAKARGSGADGVLKDARVCDSLEQALVGCHLVYGASARHQRNIAWPLENPRQCADHVAELPDDAEVAIVFGRERTGLTNAELDLCHKILHIPCNPDFSSLNVAAAVQVVSYELHMKATELSQTPVVTEADPHERAATQDEMENFFNHLISVITATEFFDPDNPRLLPRRLRRFFNRSEPSNIELNILRGILTSVEKHLK